MNSFQLESLVKVKTIEQVKKRKPGKPLYSLRSSECYANFPVPTEITGMIKKIENGKYFVQVGNYVDGKFMLSGRTLTFTEIYMSRFARLI